MKSFDESMYYLGPLCKHKHEWNGVGKSLRYLKKRYQRKEQPCVVCQRKSYTKWRENNLDVARLRQRQYFAKNKERRREVQRNARENNRESYRKYGRRYYWKHIEKTREAQRLRCAQPEVKAKMLAYNRERRDIPEVKKKHLKSVRRSMLRRRVWKNEIAYAKGCSEPTKTGLLMGIEKVVQIHASYLELRQQLRVLNKVGGRG